jgi:flagellar basal body-associated protein FliL
VTKNEQRIVISLYIAALLALFALVYFGYIVRGRTYANPGGQGLGPTVDVPTIMVGLADDGDMPMHLRMHIEAEVKDLDTKDYVQAHMNEVLDALNATMQNRKPESVEGKQGMENVKKEVLAILRRKFPDAGVKDVFITEFVRF